MGKGNHNNEALPGTQSSGLQAASCPCWLLFVFLECTTQTQPWTDLGQFITSVPGLPEGLADAVGVEISLLKQLIKRLEGASCDLSPLIDVAKNRSQKPHLLKKQSHTRIRGET